MITTGFTLARIAAEGPGLADASLEFRPGLNVVAGASSTGKTYVYQLINFLLGSSKSPKNIPLATGYSYGALELNLRAGGTHSLIRPLAGGPATAYALPLDQVPGSEAGVTLAEKNDGVRGNQNTISGRFLQYSGLAGRVVRTDSHGTTRFLSFRDLAHLCLVDEARIIAALSPVLSDNKPENTARKSVFGLLLTGTDDAAIIQQEKPKDRKIRLNAELDALRRLVAQGEQRLAAFDIDVEDLSSQRHRNDLAVARALELRAARQADLDSAAAQRDRLWAEIQQHRSRQLFVREQLKRLRLLGEHYDSDLARLESTMEAGELFERLPSGQCPVCGHTPNPARATADMVDQLRTFWIACAAERSKIRSLTFDLARSLDALKEEDGALSLMLSALETALDDANKAINKIFREAQGTADAELQSLLATQKMLSEAAFVVAEVQELRAACSRAEEMLTAKIRRAKSIRKVDSSGTSAFCDAVAQLLRAWKFPFSGKVSWSDERFDIVVGDEHRSDLGKGFRAVTHAAFTVGLMRYCRARSLPHPGLLVLDSPLNPFKGPDRDWSEQVNEEVQEAFYADLAADSSEDQVIVLENTEPPEALRSRIQYVHFSANPRAGRAGFFPQGTDDDTRDLRK